MTALEIRACTQTDLDRLVRAELPARATRLRERFAAQQRGEAVYLVAWRGGELVGHVMVLGRSKYDEVRARLGELPELNALETQPRNQGIGTRIIAAAEAIARDRGAALLGLAVEHTNHGARRLYDRLGYASWGHGTVVDRWIEPAGDGQPGIEHADACDYLVKRP